LVACYDYIRWVALFLYILDATESVSWFFTHSGFNVQVLAAIEFEWMVVHHPEIAWLFLAGLLLVAFLAFFPWISKMYIFISGHFYWFSWGFVAVLSLPYYRVIQHNLDPFQQNDHLTSELQKRYMRRLQDYFAENISAVIPDTPGRRNLIIMELESIEQQLLGPYNTIYPRSMPYLSQLASDHLFADNIITSTYTTWSVASMFAVQCNLPLLYTPTASYNAAKFHLIPSHRCCGDYLKKAGYRLESWLTNVFIGGFKPHLQLHSWLTYDKADHNITRDWDMVDHLLDKVIPRLEKEEKPWVLHWSNADTHPFPRYFIDPRCESRVKDYSFMLRSFDCLDQNVERWMKGLQKSSIWNTTEIFMYGDHLLMRGTSDIPLFDPRSMVVIVPTRPRQRISKQVSIYDFGPTMLDLIGLNYRPKFPFGVSMFSKKIGLTPDPTHFKYIYDFFRSEMKWSDKAECRVNQTGFCRNTAEG
jgi:phosphoglycerol transferase MdoB-like AlkP superfamily enzyme